MNPLQRTYIYLSALLAITAASCQQNYVDTTAKIIERNQINDTQIEVHYIFKAGNTTIAGTKNINNNTAIKDSLPIHYNKNNPLENELDLKN